MLYPSGGSIEASHIAGHFDGKSSRLQLMLWILLLTILYSRVSLMDGRDGVRLFFFARFVRLSGAATVEPSSLRSRRRFRHTGHLHLMLLLIVSLPDPLPGCLENLPVDDQDDR